MAPVFLCAALLTKPARSDPEVDRAPEWTYLSVEGVPVLVHPPSETREAPATVTVMLHGMCDVPERECPAFASAVAKRGFLVCPRGPSPCAGGGATWSSGATHLVERAVAALVARYPGRVDATARTLIGFSLGAFVAARIAAEDPVHWPHLVLIAAKAPLDPARLANNGVERVVLASGTYDLSRDHLRRASAVLASHGIATTFLSLGPVGHRFAEDMDGWTESALAWLERP
jgi:predicted esterase